MKLPGAPSLSGSRIEPVKGMHSREIVCAVWMKGTNLTQLALDNNYSEAFLRMVLRRPNEKGERIIADCIGTEPHLIWPDRYHADGTPDHAKWRRLEKRRLEQNPLGRRSAVR